MKLNKKELRKIQYDFNCISSRLMQANFQDYNNVLLRFITFINDTPIISDYILNCGPCEQDMEQEFKEVESSYNCIFSLGMTNNEEVRNIYAILKYILDNNIEVYSNIAFRYSSSRNCQDAIKDFNNRVVLVLILHIENYLTKIGIDMGLDENTTYSIPNHNGQVIIANDNAIITATNNIGIDTTKLESLIQNIRSAAVSLPHEDIDMMESNLQVIEEEIKADKPRKCFLKTAASGLHMLKGTAEFSAAVVALIQFIQPLLQ